MSKNILVPSIVILLIIGGIYSVVTTSAPKTAAIPGDDKLSFTDSIPTQSVQPSSVPLTSSTPKLSITPKDIKKMTELKIEDLKVGTGAAVKSGDTISINYLGTLLDGTKFDSSYDRGQPFETQIGVGQVIEGWDKGVVGMKVGGKRRLSIPSAMAYGSQGAGNVIPPDSDLIFEVELVAIK